ncbi:MAG: hypothetical protein GW848_06155 [Rhodoferax sp.]|nr:hypothetical protein [Rhodoferax sp.]OIP21967.1 MAG: hypothetical protein AUK52_07270 [Comamonadaceae bacterium CG2_30_60_41]
MDVSKTPTAAVQSTQKPTELQKTQAQERSQRPPVVEKAPPPPPKPVVNTQGQTTGRLVNVTA